MKGRSAMGYGGDGLMWHGGEGWGGGGWVLMTLVMVVFWGAVITAAILAIRYLAGGGSHHHHQIQASSGSARAEDVLAERFARGEIDDDEFKQRLTLLREHR